MNKKEIRKSPAQISRDYYQRHKEEMVAINARKRAAQNARGYIAGFKNCEDCATCEKTECRHNPKNPERQK